MYIVHFYKVYSALFMSYSHIIVAIVWECCGYMHPDTFIRPAVREEDYYPSVRSANDLI